MPHTGITIGTSPATFAPDETLTRAQFVTFLYRYKEEPDVTINTSTENCAPTADAPRTGFKAVSGGGVHSCGIRSDGTITCWGADNSYGLADPYRQVGSWSQRRLNPCWWAEGSPVSYQDSTSNFGFRLARRWCWSL